MRLSQLVPAGAVLLALGAIAGAAQLAGPATAGPGRAGPAQASGPRQVAVTSAVRACPPVPGGAAGTVAFIARPGTAAATAGAAATTSAAASSGQAQLAPLPLAGAALRAEAPIGQSAAGVLSLLTTPAAQSTARQTATVLQGWSVTATGAMAQAMEAEETAGSGLASVRCGEPGSDLWFAGPGQQTGARQIQLDLMNVDTLAASVDVSVITDAGPVQAGADTGLTVPPGRTVTESLSALAAGSSVVAIEVRTSVGRVAADVAESTSAGAPVSWLPATVAPSTQLVIPGVASSGGNAKLFIVVPGSANAQVSVLALTPQGQYQPFGTQTVDLPGDSSSYVPLTPLGGTAATLLLRSNVPVTAAVLVPGSGLGLFTTASEPITEQAVVAGNAAAPGLTTTMVLSAPAGSAHLRLTEVARAAGSHRAATASSQVTASQDVTVPAGRTLGVTTVAPKGAAGGAAFAVVITPLAGSGPLYAARVATQGQGGVVSIIPAVSALTTVALPPVRDSYTAISP
jgi:hypothetical protein